MPTDVSDLRPTIVPKSDQLNAEQLLGGSMTITVSDVRVGSSDEQPISVHYDNDGGRPFKPCKTMRKVLIFAWGPDGREWIGRAMTLYNDPQVKFGGAEVGGIRISHMTDIERDVQVSLTATKGKKALHTIRRMERAQRVSPEDLMTSAPTVEDLKATFGTAYKATKDAALRANLKAAYDKRLAALTTPTKTAADFVVDIDTAADKDAALAVVDEALKVLSAEDMTAVNAAYEQAWS